MSVCWICIRLCLYIRRITDRLLLVFQGLCQVRIRFRETPYYACRASLSAKCTHIYTCSLLMLFFECQINTGWIWLVLATFTAERCRRELLPNATRCRRRTSASLVISPSESRRLPNASPTSETPVDIYAQKHKRQFGLTQTAARGVGNFT